MAEWIGEPTLAMDPPWHMVILEVFETAGRARFQCASDYRASGSSQNNSTLTVVVPYFLRAIPGVLGGLGEEEGRTRDLQTGDWSEAPQFCCAEGSLVPFDRSRGVGNRQHEGNDWGMWLGSHEGRFSVSVLLTANGTRPHSAAYHCSNVR